MKTTSKLVIVVPLVATVLPMQSLAQGLMFIENDRVGIVTATPTAPVDINIGTNTPGTGNTVLRLERVGPVGFQLKDSNDTKFWQFSNAAGGSELRISKSGTGKTELKLTTTGNLTVEGNIVSNGTTFVPDYVFDETYELMPLAELASFIEAERHLPKVPAADEIKQSGLNMTDMQMRLLEKIEELTLYTLEQHKTILEQHRTIEELRDRVAAVERDTAKQREKPGRPGA